MRTPNNPMGFISAFQNFMQNPSQFITQMNIPREMSGNPDKIIQHMMDSGMISQEQYNYAKRTAEQMKSNPMFRGMFR